MEFFSKEHEERYIKLCNRGRMHPDDVFRKAMFYIVANSEAYDNVDGFYDFDKNVVKATINEETGKYEIPHFTMSSSGYMLYRIAIHLYGAYLEPVTIEDAFTLMKGPNSRLFVNALKIRYPLIEW